MERGTEREMERGTERETERGTEREMERGTEREMREQEGMRDGAPDNGALNSGSPTRQGDTGPPGASSPSSHKLGFSYNRDADLIKKKRASLRHSESETASDCSGPTPNNHADTPTKQEPTPVPSSPVEKKVQSRQEELKKPSWLLTVSRPGGTTA
ncbi:hypothetical protein J4Q44_G00361760 [Coregonus suidteri]|uniref:Uncharacterized protein n=1 Tax=Coregonus suidteri TaxID=861788 RepID=A0AAN8KR64_9TELE